MKRYQILMERYRLSPARYEELCKMCRPPRSREVDEMIHAALSKTNPDVLGRFILDYVTRPGFTVAKLQQCGLPCHPRTFAVHKAHFFHELDKIAPHVGNSADNVGNAPEL